MPLRYVLDDGETEPGSADVADVEHQPAENDEDREQVPGAGNGGVGVVGGAPPRQHGDPPDVHLHDEVDEDGGEDREGEDFLLHPSDEQDDRKTKRKRKAVTPHWEDVLLGVRTNPRKKK